MQALQSLQTTSCTRFFFTNKLSGVLHMNQDSLAASLFQGWSLVKTMSNVQCTKDVP